MKNICFLVSGGGGTLKFIDKALKKFQLPYKISGVISDRKCGAVDYCINSNISYHILYNWKVEESYLNAILNTQSPDIVITTIHKKLSNDTLQSTQANFINLHYSLLPSYGGVIGFKTLELAKSNNAKIIGVTTHHVTENLDGGDIIAQAAMPVDWTEDWEKIGDKIFRIACLTILNTLIYTDKLTVANIFDNPSDVIFSPKLCFDINCFSETFWDSLK